MCIHKHQVCPFTILTPSHKRKKQAANIWYECFYKLRLSKKPGDNKGKKSKQVSMKYTASRLHEKGVLIEIEDLQTNQWVLLPLRRVFWEYCFQINGFLFSENSNHTCHGSGFSVKYIERDLLLLVLNMAFSHLCICVLVHNHHFSFQVQERHLWDLSIRDRRGIWCEGKVNGCALGNVTITISGRISARSSIFLHHLTLTFLTIQCWFNWNWAGNQLDYLCNEITKIRLAIFPRCPLRISCSCSMRAWLWWSSSTRPPSTSTCLYSCSTRSSMENKGSWEHWETNNTSLKVDCKKKKK